MGNVCIYGGGHALPDDLKMIVMGILAVALVIFLCAELQIEAASVGGLSLISKHRWDVAYWPLTAAPGTARRGRYWVKIGHGSQ
jgi:hypothetical protein